MGNLTTVAMSKVKNPLNQCSCPKQIQRWDTTVISGYWRHWKQTDQWVYPSISIPWYMVTTTWYMVCSLLRVFVRPIGPPYQVVVPLLTQERQYTYCWLVVPPGKSWQSRSVYHNKCHVLRLSEIFQYSMISSELMMRYLLHVTSILSSELRSTWVHRQPLLRS